MERGGVVLDLVLFGGLGLLFVLVWLLLFDLAGLVAYGDWLWLVVMLCL